ADQPQTADVDDGGRSAEHRDGTGSAFGTDCARTWCSMYAGESGRACGSIAKVRRMRAAQKERAAVTEAG
ncbi:hypothetical protein, partial [Streptomyces sp. NPDC005568]|uniref:hypothetical protein n=1 Tax=Streptomyces sp. NPDC005568 TaxID=3156887 RepID=UPI0033A19263